MIQFGCQTVTQAGFVYFFCICGQALERRIRLFCPASFMPQMPSITAILQQKRRLVSQSRWLGAGVAYSGAALAADR